ncbi:F-box/LRR-repeat protein 2-like [Aphidius gifuensis]|uniref:F-box/LRR-repeat protein 2-like n=1 Tax=Aphidius gifuensis TaxID=684658 RepID=UPI001CDB5F3B|nr:F-box/LRR-repeat protein 2-like [Aphidius gifuensis]
MLDVAGLQKESIIAISNNCKKLKRLEILGCAIVPSVFDELSKLQCLEHLNLGFAENLKDSTITAIANNCKNLKSLEIKRCTGLTETALVALSNLENLQKLDVSYLDIITDSFLINLKGLKELHCNECKKLTNAGIIQFIKNNPDLELLNVHCINNITFDMIIAADQSLLKMSAKIICIEKDQQISDDGDKDEKAVINSLDYDSLAKIIMLLPIPERINMEKDGPYYVERIPVEKWINFQNLQYLGISCDMIPDLANTIVEYCKNLKHLRITSHNIMDTAFKKLTELKNLECLILDGNYSLKEESIIVLSNNCKKLKRLDIADCIIAPAIRGDPLSSPPVLDELSKLQCLEHLNLSFAENLKDSTITAIANNCKNLKSLDIQGCCAITETSLVVLSDLKNLQKLNVSCIDIITDSFLMKLKGLKEFYCYECKELTNAGIIQFIKNNPDLEILDVSYYTDNITIDMIIAADQATENRTNGIILHINLDNRLMKEVNNYLKPIITSQWLVVNKFY